MRIYRSGDRCQAEGRASSLDSAPAAGTKSGAMCLNLGSVESRGPMSSPDQETLLRAVEDARRILGEYIEPGQRDPARTLQRLLAVLDKNGVVYALDRMKRPKVMRLVEGTTGLAPFQLCFVQKKQAIESWTLSHPDKLGLLDVVRNARPTMERLGIMTCQPT